MEQTAISVAPRPTPIPGRSRGRSLALLALGLAAAIVVALWAQAGGTLSSEGLGGQFSTFITIFLGIFIEALPFLLIGVLMSAVIQVFVTAETIQRWAPRNRVASALFGTFLGLAFPVCECGSVPAARRLMHKGAPLPLGLAFMLAAPVINPVVIASTWVAFGGDPFMVLGRVGLTVLIAGAVAILIGLHPAPQSLLTADSAALAACCAPAQTSGGWRGRARSVIEHSATEFFEMGQYVVLGALLAALAQTVVPQELLLRIGGNPVTSVLVMMALAVVLSICSTVDAFVALGFASTFSSGAILAFLVFGPMIDIKAVLLFFSTLKRRAVGLVVLLVAQMAFLAGVWINLNW